MELRLRRLLPRQFTDWHGRYMVEGDPDEAGGRAGSSTCRHWVPGSSSSTPPPRRWTGGASSCPSTCEGEVRHAVSDKGDGLRVGIQFVDLTEAESRRTSGLW